jgi:purine-binding chemotaxis protein CheW
MSMTKQRPDPQKSLVGFQVGDVSYAVSIASVKEIINPIALTELPHAPPAIAGVADHRGEVVPLIDLRSRFGLPRMGPGRKPKWILVDLEGRTVGLIVDRVTEVFGTGRAGLRQAPALGTGDQLRGISGVTSHEGELTFVLDVTRFAELMAPLQSAGMLGPGEGSR